MSSSVVLLVGLNLAFPLVQYPDETLQSRSEDVFRKIMENHYTPLRETIRYLELNSSKYCSISVLIYNTVSN